MPAVSATESRDVRVVVLHGAGESAFIGGAACTGSGFQ